MTPEEIKKARDEFMQKEIEWDAQRCALKEENQKLRAALEKIKGGSCCPTHDECPACIAHEALKND